MKTIIFDFNRTLYNPETNQLIPGALRLLQTLKKRGYILHLITRQEGNRKALINNLGIKKYFQTILLVKRKTLTQFKKLGAQNAVVFVVGDWIPEEIVLGNKLGYITIWYQTGNTKKEFPFRQNERPAHIVGKLSHITRIIP